MVILHTALIYKLLFLKLTNHEKTGNVFCQLVRLPWTSTYLYVEVEIGGQRIDRQYGDWMHIWNELTMTAEQQDGYNKMIGNTTQLTYIDRS